MSIASTFDVLTATAAIGIRPWAGVNVNPAVQKPEKTLILYEFEGCPFCRLVREALTELDLEVLILPCPKGGTRFRPEVEARGGMTQFPYLVDPNDGLEMYESMDIVEYLFEAYGGRRPGLAWQIPAPFQVMSAAAVGAMRIGRGTHVRPSKEPEEPLELWSFEASPFARPVRELLCEMELPYVLHNAGRNNLQDWAPPPVRQRLFPDYEPTLESRKELKERTGQVGIPYLFDPNTEEGLFESQDILAYLKETYSA